MAKNRPDFSETQRQAFAAAADPHQWLQSPSDLLEQAIALHQQRGLSSVALRRPGLPPVSWDGVNRATFLLAALALESAIKAFLVYEHPEWIGDGRLHDELCTHKLTRLAARSSLIPYRDGDQEIWAAFEDGNESGMRYPCGRHADDIAPQRPMEDRFWRQYRRLMRGYGSKLERLFAKGWTKPSDHSCTWSLGWRYLD